MATATFVAEAGHAVDDIVQPLDKLTLKALDLVQEQLDSYVQFPSAESRDAVVLWILHTHVFRAFDSTPRLSLRSSEPGSGKSRVLELVEGMAPRVLSAVHLTPGVMWRSIEQRSPTVLLDEADTVFGKAGSGSSHRELRAILNAGHKRGAMVPRCVGSEDVKMFHVFTPVALAGIGRLPETIATRSVEIVMRKRKSGDPELQNFKMRTASKGLSAAFGACEEWSSRAFKRLSCAMPDMPVTDRQADVWEPLVAIADTASPEWGERARKACVRLTKEAEEKTVSVGLQLLEDLREVVPADVEAVTPAELLGLLYGVEDGVWSSGQFTSREIQRLLAEYDVSATTVRISGKPTRAFKREALARAWERHLPEGADDADAA